MASIEKKSLKKGISYLITVTHGRDVDGKQIKHRKTWTPPEGMTPKKAEKEVNNVAYEFEQQILKGFSLDNRQTFAQYAEYVLNLKEASGKKHKTIESYRYLLKRINAEIGHLKLNEIRAAHLNAFYIKLAKQGVRSPNEKAIVINKAIIPEHLKSHGYTHENFAKISGISSATVDALCLGHNVSPETAKKVSTALDVDISALFKFQGNTRPLSKKTIREYHRCIHTILAQAEKEMLVPFNVADRADPPVAERKDVNYFQPEQISAILAALDDEPIKWKTIINLLVVSGCRRGEIASLKWKNVDFKNSKIKIDSTLLYSSDKGVYENATKTRDIRFLKIPAQTMRLLKEYQKWYMTLRTKNGDRWFISDYCFVTDDGHPMNPDSITAWCKKFSERHNLPHINPHAFRHTVASTLINQGKDIVTVSKRLGHSRTSTTIDVYAHVMAEADEDASDCIADVLLGRAQ